MPPAARLFALPGREAAGFGTAVHRLLAQVEWGPATEELARAKARGESADALAETAAVLAAPELAAVWTRPAGVASAEVWRERSFEMVWDEAWVTGTMDRVIIERAADGRPVRATVFDFKTDRVEAAEAATAARAHDSQMRLYRQAAARLTGLPEAEVGGFVVFTRLRGMAAAGR